jgi:hypothetical protein
MPTSRWARCSKFNFYHAKWEIGARRSRLGIGIRAALVGVAAGAAGVAGIVLVARATLIALVASRQKQSRDCAKNEDYLFHNFAVFFFFF